MSDKHNDIRSVAVLGGGLMGSGIAQVCATSGYATTVREVSDELCDRSRAAILGSFDRAIEKGKSTGADKEAALKLIRFTTSLNDLASADIVIEAVVEDLAVKSKMFAELDKLCGPDTIFASNTSSLTIGEIAAATSRADRFVGMHFFNPVPAMKLVEVVRAIKTSPATVERALAFVRSLGKDPIRAHDNSGFVVNLLLVPYMIDAIRALESGVASIADIDKGMMLGAGYPMGPFTLLDFVGLDTTYRIAEIMYDEYRESRYAPPSLLKRMVIAGMYGRKSGMGFYDYSKTPPVPNDLGV
ncbi:MAG TPA: 3-hydroxybutyryl-CoA dehydrogenase [Gemmatimonadaceae bacterium]|nr:3-hydroxybutyryl-CoA dehydrogenase [Gemmatimonadaceae bacterium]